MRSAHGRGFVLVELVAMIVVLGLLGVMLAVSAGESRRLARLGEDIAKLRQIGAWTGSYAADNSDQFWTLSWKKGQSLSQYPDLNNAADDLQAAANQAVDILRRVAGRTDIQPINAWFAQVSYSHLVLADYLSAALPEGAFVGAGDRHRMTWARDPAGFDAGVYSPAPTGAPGTNNGKRWPYSSSFLFSTSYFDGSPVGSRITQAGLHFSYIVPSGFNAAPRTLAEVGFPSSKVLTHDTHGRHFGARVAYCLVEEARLPIAFTDGAVRVRAAQDANEGWLPNSPQSSAPTTLGYQPDVWEPPTIMGTASDIVEGRFRWTRGFVDGRDFDGPEVCTGQPGCP